MNKLGRSCSSHWAMRCSQGKNGCGRKFTLNKPLKEYKKPVACPHCGCNKVFDREEAYLKQLASEERCKCLNIPFPHRKGSIPGCLHSKEFETGMTEFDISAYDSIINTKRGSNG